MENHYVSTFFHMLAHLIFFAIGYLFYFFAVFLRLEQVFCCKG